MKRWKGGGNLRDAEGLIEGALGLCEGIEGLEESMILHSVEHVGSFESRNREGAVSLICTDDSAGLRVVCCQSVNKESIAVLK